MFYPAGLEGLLDGTIPLSSGAIRGALVRSYTYNTSHKFLADVVSAGGTIVATTGTLASKTFTSGVFNAADDTFGTPASGAACPVVLLYLHTGSNATARVIFHATDYAGLPVTPDGTNPIPVVWDATGIFLLSN